MFKEIFEQPDALRNTLRGRMDMTKGVMLEHEIGPAEIFESMKHVVIVGFGSSRHAALVGEFLIEGFARLHVDVDYASEFPYRDPMLGPETLVVFVTQSGETADTLGVMQKARDKGAFVLSVCNVKGSVAARMADAALYTYAGPEIGVASTKTFITQLGALYLLGLFLASARSVMSHDEIRTRLRLLNRVPEQIERILDNGPAIEALAGRLCDYPHALYLGGGINLPIALEGAFKLNQISFIHAEAYPSAEMKHGLIALVDKATPVVVLAPQDNVYRKTLSSLDEVKARDGLVLAVAREGDQDIAKKTDYVVRIPDAEPFLNPFLTVVPLQLLACYAAALRGIGLDRPRNLSKSATVE
jgi:glucosamine--fructose-6-phosphate aminotransferase (isomerizing)